MYKLRKLMSIVLVTLLVMSMGACSNNVSDTKTEDTSAPSTANSQENSDTTTDISEDDLSEAKFRIGFASDDLSTDFAAALAEGIEKVCNELSYDLEMTDGQKDPNLQASQVENMITNGCDAIIITPYDISACGPISTACEEAGIPLIIGATTISTYFSAAVCMDTEAVGAKKAEMIVEALGGEGDVMFLMGPLAQEQWTTQKEAAMAVFEQYPGINVLDEQTGNNKRDESVTVTENWISAGYEFDAIWCSNDATAIGAGLACQEADLEVYIIGQGGQEEGCSLIKDGLFDATLYLPGSLYGSSAAEIASQILNGESVEEVIYLDILPVTEENVDEYLK